MARKVFVCIAGISVCTIMLLTGCTSQVELALNPDPGNVTTYKVATEVIKDFKFEQPSLDKVKEERTSAGIGSSED